MLEPVPVCVDFMKFLVQFLNLVHAFPLQCILLGVETFELKEHQDVVGLNRSLQRETELRFVADEVIEHRHKCSVELIKLLDNIAVTG